MQDHFILEEKGRVTFSNLNIGDLFEFFGSFYVKIREIQILNDNNAELEAAYNGSYNELQFKNTTGIFNAVNIEKGTFYFFTDFNEVTLYI